VHICIPTCWMRICIRIYICIFVKICTYIYIYIYTWIYIYICMYVIDCNCIHVYLSQPHSPSTRLSGVFTARVTALMAFCCASWFLKITKAQDVENLGKPQGHPSWKKDPRITQGCRCPIFHHVLAISRHGRNVRRHVAGIPAEDLHQP
jgi:hypothetical protein